MNDEEKLAAINETNKEIFELTEKALKENPIFSYKNEKTGEVDNFRFVPEMSLEIKNWKKVIKSKFYVFENENSGEVSKFTANGILRRCRKTTIFKGVEDCRKRGVNSDMGVAQSRMTPLLKTINL